MDAQRFELRRIEGTSIQEIRCVYPAALESVAEECLRKQTKIRVYGKVERSAEGDPKLLEIERFEPVLTGVGDQITWGFSANKPSTS